MAGFVAEQPHEPVGRAALGLEHDLFLEPLQSFVGQVKRDPDRRHADRAKPFIRQETGRLVSQPARVQFAIQFLDPTLKRRTRELETELANAQLEQLLVVQPGPFHGGHGRNYTTVPTGL